MTTLDVLARRANPEAMAEAEAKIIELAEAVRPGSRYITLLRKAQAAQVNTMERDLRRHFSELGDHVAAAAAAVEGLVVEEAASTNETHRIDLIVAAAALDTWAGDRLGRAFKEHYKRTAQIVLDHLEREGIDVGNRAKTAQRILETGGKRLGLIDLKQDTKTALFRVLNEAREKGLNPRFIAKTIKDMVPAGRFVNAGSGYRAQLIARTEMLHAQRAATLEALRNSPRVNHVIAFDGDSDEDCAARDGEIFTLDEAEIEMESDTTHPNCVLAFAPYTA